MHCPYAPPPVRAALGGAGLFAGLLLAGCADAPTAAPASGPAQLRMVSAASAYPAGPGAKPSFTPQELAALDVVARLVARALSRPEGRTLLRDVLRASPLSEHKIDLRPFLRTPEGRRLVTVGASLVDDTPAAVSAALAAVPDADLYLLSSEHRRRWRATDDVGVVIVNGGPYRHTVLLPNGGTTVVDLETAVPSMPLVALGPSEPKSRRVGAQPAGRAGDVIQDADDGELSGRQVLRAANGDSLAVELADPDGARKLAVFAAAHLPRAPYAAPPGAGPRAARAAAPGGGGARPSMIPCGEPGASLDCNYDPPPPPPPPPDTTLLRSVRTDGFCDNANCAEGNEFEFYGTFHAYFGGPELASSHVSIHGFGSSETHVVNLPIMFRIPRPQTEYVEVKIKEIDSFPNADDDVGNPAYVQFNRNWADGAQGFGHLSNSWVAGLEPSWGFGPGKMWTSYQWTRKP